MAIDVGKLTAAGYYLNAYGSWQRGFIPGDNSGATEPAMGVEAYEGGTISGNLNTINNGLGMSLVFRPDSVSQTVNALDMARNVAKIHQYELTIAVDEIHQKQLTLDESLSGFQNKRIDAEIALNNSKNSPAQERAKLLLALQNAIKGEINARISAEENAVKYIEYDIILNNGRIWWPVNESDANDAKNYIKKREVDKGKTNQLISEDKNNLAISIANIENTKKDIERINRGEVLERYRPENEKVAEARAKANAEAKARAEAEARAKTAELMTKAGVKPTPVYTPEMVKSAQASLAAVGAMVLNRAPGMLQLSTAAEGVLTTTSELAGSIAGAVWRGAIALAEAATVSTAGATVSALVMGFWPTKAGEGSDKLYGRDIVMFGFQANLIAAGKVSISPEMHSVDLPVRGSLVMENGQQQVRLVKTGIGGVPASVSILKAVRDEKTGLDRITLPAVGGAPSRTILVNPAPVGPTAPPHTGNSSPAPVTPVHTGTTVKQADSIVTTSFPADDIKELQDFIYWQPDATGSGVEPIYVMVSKPYGESNAKGKYSGRDFHTEKAGGPIQNLDWKTAKIDRAGVDKVKLHTGRFGEQADNKVMVDRLEKILKGELVATDTDKRFYTHEVRELERYRNLGIKDGDIPENYDEVWNNTHTATLEDYKVNEINEPLYTPEAEEAYRKSEEGK
ncbi:S-type pyocin domain-containing protein [Serratia sp. TSA_198.1]|uniref:S-type pyocin domain-containing protein n=1 Tax=Serratia sp. TSA_198.1 TaxID=3415664 RepID=UPI00404601DE